MSTDPHAFQAWVWKVGDLRNVMDYYVYGHYIPGSEVPFYIGKGRGKRARDISNRNKWWHNIKKKHGYEIKYLYESMSPELACEKEKELIKQYGRRDIGTGCLVNLTEGGDGTGGQLFTKEYRQKLSKGLKRYYESDENRKKVSELRKKTASSPEFREKCKQAALRGWQTRKQQTQEEQETNGTNI